MDCHVPLPDGGATMGSTTLHVVGSGRRSGTYMGVVCKGMTQRPLFSTDWAAEMHEIEGSSIRAQVQEAP